MKLSHLFFALSTISMLQSSECEAFSWRFLSSLIPRFSPNNIEPSQPQLSQQPTTTHETLNVPPSSESQQPTFKNKKGFLSKVYLFFAYHFGMVSPEEVKAGVQKTKETLRKEMDNTNTVLKEGIEKNNETLTTLAENVNENADTISTVKNKFLEKNNEANTELDRLTKKFKEASQTTSALETQSKNLLTDMLRIQTLIHQNNSAIENHIKAERELETQSEEQTHILKVLKGKINEADKRIEKVEKRNDRLLDLLDMATFIIERLKKHATNKNSKLSNTIVTFQEGCQRYNLTVSLNNGLSDMPRNNNALTMFPYRLATSSENMLEYSTGYTKVTDL